MSSLRENTDATKNPTQTVTPYKGENDAEFTSHYLKR